MAVGRDVHRLAASAQAARRVLDPQALRTVGAAAEAILPRGDTPGATDARVSAFVDWMLAGWYPAPDRERFLTGLRALNTHSTELHGREFAACIAADQSAMLTVLDQEVSALRASDAARADAHWFAILKYLTIWGYCTSEVGARSLGLNTLPMRYDGNAPVTSQPAG